VLELAGCDEQPQSRNEGIRSNSGQSSCRNHWDGRTKSQQLLYGIMREPYSL
jgi:hypothetical protein